MHCANIKIFKTAIFSHSVFMFRKFLGTNIVSLNVINYEGESTVKLKCVLSRNLLNTKGT